MNAWLVWGPFNLSDATDAQALFKLWLNSEYGVDKASIMASTNNVNFYGTSWSGSTNGAFNDMDLNLTDPHPELGNLCGKQSVWIAFVFESNGSVNYEGAYVDNLIIEKYVEKPNLTSVTPLGWSNPIVVSTQTATNTNASVYYSNQDLYVDIAHVNNGNLLAGNHKTTLWVDDKSYNFSTSALATDTYSYYEDFNIGKLSIGNHTVKMVIDSQNEVSESDETDNEFSTIINVKSGQLPNLAPFKPTGWNSSIVVSNVKGTTQTSSTLKANQSLFVDVAWGNSGGGVAAAHKTRLMIDDISYLFTSDGLATDYYAYYEDFEIGRLSEGMHVFKLFVDMDKTIAETNESDNEVIVYVNVIAGTDPEIEVVPTEITINQTSLSSGNEGNVSMNGHGKGRGLRIPENVKSFWNSQMPNLKYNKIDLRQSVDWSVNDTPVRDQGNCGSCWAFAAVSLVENLYDGNIDLAEQTLVSCVEDAHGCDGGWYGYALQYIANNGIPNESCHPYSQSNGACNSRCSNPEQLIQLSEYDLYGHWSEPTASTVNDLKYLLQTGPVLVSMIVPNDGTFDDYSGGIYDYQGGPITGDDNGHAVLVVGYNDTEKYFRAKSSWGSSWGENGYFRIAFDDVTDDVQFGGYPCMASGVFTGCGSSNSFTVKNAGTGNLVISGITSNATWLSVQDIPAVPFTIAPGDDHCFVVSVNWSLVTEETMTGFVTIRSNDADEEIVNVKVTVKKAVNRGNTVIGIVTDATTGRAIPGVEVKIASITDITDSYGNYELVNVPSGLMTADFYADNTTGVAPLNVTFHSTSTDNSQTITAATNGYISYSYDHLNVDPEVAVRHDISMSPTILNDEMRIILTWGDQPRDLDSHLKTPVIGSQQHHIFWNSKGNSSSAPYAILDVDDVTSYGPETITLSKFYNGTYNYYIHQYSSDGSLASSGAIIKVYGSQGLLQTLQVPTTGSGKYWHVFNIDGLTRQISIINRIVDEAPGFQATINATKTTALNSYLWDFGDGTTSSIESPSHTYTAAGNYSVKLTVGNGSTTKSKTNSNYISVQAPYNGPDWTPISYTNSTVAYGIVTIDGIPAQIDDKVGAFVNNQCRGFGNIIISNGVAYTTMIIHGDLAESVQFKIWDASQNKIFPNVLTVMSNPGGAIGYPPGYLLLSANGNISQNLSLVKGWNLSSLYVTNNNMNPKDLFYTPLQQNLTQIKSLTQSYDPTLPDYLNTLKNIVDGRGYLIKVSSDQTVALSGQKVDGDNIGLSLASGWNIIGFPFDIQKAVNTVFRPLISGNKLLQLKNLSKSFDPSVPEFLNTLTNMVPGEGYFVKVNSNCNIYSGNFQLSANPFFSTPDWNPTVYTNSTTMYGLVTIDGVSAAEGDIVAAFVGDECRGVQPVVVNNNVAYVTLVIQGEREEEVTFKLYDTSSDAVLRVITKTTSKPGDRIGFPPNFVELKATVVAENQKPIAVAGVDKVVKEHDVVILNALESKDPEGGALTYLWIPSGSIQINNPNEAVTFFVAPDVNSTTDFKIALMVVDNQMSISYDTIKVTVNYLVSKDDLSNQLISVYPNPSEGKFFVDLGTLSGDFTQLELLNSSGVVVKRQPIDRKETSESFVDACTLPKGVYLVKVISDNKMIIKKVVLK
jgi:PKD repeat protein/C1A family cysteine protease